MFSFSVAMMPDGRLITTMDPGPTLNVMTPDNLGHVGGLANFLPIVGPSQAAVMSAVTSAADSSMAQLTLANATAVKDQCT